MHVDYSYSERNMNVCQCKLLICKLQQCVCLQLLLTPLTPVNKYVYTLHLIQLTPCCICCRRAGLLGAAIVRKLNDSQLVDDYCNYQELEKQLG